MRNFPKPLFYLIQWTWGLPVNLFGGIGYLFCKLKGYRTEKFENAVITYVPWKYGGLGTGIFLFLRPHLAGAGPRTAVLARDRSAELHLVPLL